MTKTPLEILQRRKKILFFFSILTCLVTLLLFGALYLQADLLHNIKALYFSEAEIEKSDNRILFLSTAYTVLWLLFYFFFYFWFHRAYRNSILLSEKPLRNTPGWAVAHFFLPIISLWYPYKSTKEIWNTSCPSGKKYFFLPLLWWIFFILDLSFSQVAGKVMEGAEEISEIIQATYYLLGAFLFSLISLFLTLLLVIRITEMQKERIAELPSLAEKEKSEVS